MCHQNYDEVTWVRWDPGERPLIHTGLTLRRQTGEKRRQGPVLQKEGTAYKEARRRRRA